MAKRVLGAPVRRHVSLALLLSVAASGLACKSTKSTPPQLEDVTLSLWPASAAVNDGGGSVTVVFSVGVADAGADVTELDVTVLDPTGGQIAHQADHVTNPPDVTSGALGGNVAIPTTLVARYTIQLQAFDSRGSGSNVVQRTFDVFPGNPAPVLGSLSPSTAAAADPGFLLTVKGSGFVASSTVLWNGWSLPTTFVDGSTLTASVSASDVSYVGTAQITVFTPPPGGGTSSALTFTVTPPPPSPVPVLTSLSPSSAVAGSEGITVTLTGSGFVRSSTVHWGYGYLSTTFVNDSTLQVTIPSYNLSIPGPSPMTVINPAPGGGTSGALTFTVTRPAQPGVTVVELQANDLAWDPYQQKIYLSVPSLSPLAPNTIAILDPFTGALTGSQFAGSEPGSLALSDDGQFLYVGLRGASFVNRFTLPGLTQDLDIPLGRDPTYGQLYARDLQVPPGSPHALAVSLGAASSTWAQGGLVVFDDATPRLKTASASLSRFDSLQWGPDATVLYAANNEYFAYDLYTLAVDGSGVALAHDYPGAFSSYYGNRIHFDAGTGLVYGDEGHAVDPAIGLTVGTYAATGYYWGSRVMVPDSTVGSAFFAGQGSSSWVDLQAYDLTHFIPTRSTTLAYVAPPARRLVRWGPDGLAMLATNTVVLVRGSAVVPVALTANPVPTVSSLSPSSQAAGSGNFRLGVTGTGFVPGAVLSWSGSDRETRVVSSTQLIAFIPASDVAAAGSAEIVVRNPSPGGGASTAVILDVTP